MAYNNTHFTLISWFSLICILIMSIWPGNVIYGLCSMIIEHFCVNPTIILPHKEGNERILWNHGVHFYSLIGKICHFWVRNAWFLLKHFFQHLRFQISKTGSIGWQVRMMWRLIVCRFEGHTKWRINKCEYMLLKWQDCEADTPWYTPPNPRVLSKGACRLVLGCSVPWEYLPLTLYSFLTFSFL